MPSREWHAARAAKRLAAHQAALAPEDRIVNRTDWDDAVQKKVSVLTRQACENAKQIFLSVASDPTVDICGSREEAEAYFQKDGATPFTNRVLRKFVETYAISHIGYIQEELSSRSLESLVIHLFTAAKTAGNPVERDIEEAFLLWLEGPMLSKGLAHRNMREKSTPIPQDITSFLRHLFDRRFMATLPTTRHTLLIALFVCLQVDCSSRISELLRPSMSAETEAAYNVEHKEKIFIWGCVEFYAFKGQDAGTVSLQARLTFRSIKGLESKANRKKTIPLRLLPPAYVAEDSLFWLMTLALIDGVFEGVSSWSDIEHLQPGPNGQIVPIKSSMQEVPVKSSMDDVQTDCQADCDCSQVFRAVESVYPSSQADLISKKQLGAQAMIWHLHRLSRFCGLKHAMLPNVLRRGSAYLLALTVTKEERCARMGHSENSSTYWSYYRNTTSTVDFQGLRHNIEQVDITAMSSVFLDTGNEQTPDRVSKEGMAEIRQDPELLAILAEQSDMTDELVLKHGSLESARAADPDRHRSYMQLRNTYSKKLSRLQDKKFKEEYKAYWETRKGGGPSDSHQAAAEPPAPVVEPGEDEALLDELEQEVTEDETPIDPQLLAEEAEAAESRMSLTADLDAGEAAGEFSDVVQQEDGAQGGDSSSAGSSSEGRSFAVRDVGRHSLVDHVPTYLYDQPQGITRAELSAIFVTAFNHLHPADRFYPSEEPLPGTYECRFCGLAFYDQTRIHLHAQLCEGERLAQDTLDRLLAGDAGAVDKCPLMHLKKDGVTLYQCWFKLRDTWRPFRDHVNHYHREQLGSEDRYVCRNHGAPLSFGSLQDFRMHIVTAHNAQTSILKYQRPTGGLALEELLFFCPFCQVWISRADQLEETHLATHLNDAAAAITARGLSGSFVSTAWVHPAFCPFCVYDSELSVVTRFHQFGDFRYFLTHVSGHLKGIKDTTTCPAAVATPEGLPQCTSSASLDADGLAAHLREAHGLDVKVPEEKPTAEKEPVEGSSDSEDVPRKRVRATTKKSSAKKASAKKASAKKASAKKAPAKKAPAKKASAKKASAKKAPAKKVPAKKAPVEESSESEDVQSVEGSSESEDVPRKRVRATAKKASTKKAPVDVSSDSEDMPRKRVRAPAKKAFVEDSQDSDAVQPKKAKAAGRQPLGEIDANQRAN